MQLLELGYKATCLKNCYTKRTGGYIITVFVEKNRYVFTLDNIVAFDLLGISNSAIEEIEANLIDRRWQCENKN